MTSRMWLLIVNMYFNDGKDCERDYDEMAVVVANFSYSGINSLSRDHLFSVFLSTKKPEQKKT